ncbi:MAG: glycosyltransferase [Planctomyces sp.]|nr:glycosyltransferase [Planctomyces sp.]
MIRVPGHPVDKSADLAFLPNFPDQSPSGDVELTVVMPCLNEGETVAFCVTEAIEAISANGIRGEVLVADNGSKDGSADAARGAGARVVHVEQRGYGCAIQGGVAAASGKFVILGDADGSYDFGEIPRLLDRLRRGEDLVMGCRLPGGGGRIEAGAMPALHQHIGNPLLSWAARLLCGAPVHDIYCGLRGFRRRLLEETRVRSSGMEFAAEMVVKASIFGHRIGEVPVTLRADRRVTGRSHLRTFRDGWSGLALFLMHSPNWLFLVPGVLLMLLGAAGYALAMPGVRLFGAVLDAHTLLVSTLALLVGYQSMLFGAFVKWYGADIGLLPTSKASQGPWLSPNQASGLGGLLMVAGIALLGAGFLDWKAAGFGQLDYAYEMRKVIPGVLLASLGFQTVLAGFFAGILRLGRQ